MGSAVRTNARAGCAAELGIASISGGRSLQAMESSSLARSLDPAIRAFDVETGKELWQVALPASARSTPMIFTGPNGKQYVVIAAGGHTPEFGKFDNAIVAFALP